jgi:hypothetical protein
LEKRGLLPAALEEPAAYRELLLHTAIEENEDLRELLSRNGNHRYFSVQFPSETYARNLLQKDGDPTRRWAFTGTY